MATLNSTLRTFGASVRRMEREQQRRARIDAKNFKEQQKITEFHNASQAVLNWENYIETLQSIHKHRLDPIDWYQISDTAKPAEPLIHSKHEERAKFALHHFEPSFFDKLLNRTQKKIDQLNEQVAFAQQKDRVEYDEHYSAYLIKVDEWTELQEICSGVHNMDPESYKKVIQHFELFAEIGELGTEISMKFESNHLDIDLHVNSQDLIPNYELKLTSTGKMSRKDMPKSRFNEIYQDHVCSAALRIASDVFAYLPIDHVRINALANVINTRTGHLEEQPILSVLFVPQTLNQLNFDSIDPSDSIQNFVHRMSFNKTKGFGIVDKVEFDK